MRDRQRRGGSKQREKKEYSKNKINQVSDNHHDAFNVRLVMTISSAAAGRETKKKKEIKIKMKMKIGEKPESENQTKQTQTYFQCK